jgi:hypothetical protein
MWRLEHLNDPVYPTIEVTSLRVETGSIKPVLDGFLDLTITARGVGEQGVGLDGVGYSLRWDCGSESVAVEWQNDGPSTWSSVAKWADRARQRLNALTEQGQ